MKKRITVAFIIFIFGIASILPGISVSAAHINISYDTTSELPDSHIIEGVPYISQETSFYCFFGNY